MIALRPARSTDAGKVGAILSEFVDTTPWMPQLHTRAQDVAHAGRLIDRGWVTVAELQGSVAGFSAREGSDLDALFVAKSARGQGIGTALLDQMKAVSDTLELWTFVANDPAQSFYLKHGFVEITRTDGANNDEGLPDIRYRWQQEST